MQKIPRLECLIAFLLVITIATVTINHNTPREFTIAPGSDWEVVTTDDRDEGGTSIASGQTTETGFHFEYKIQDSFHSPYAIMTLRRRDGQPLDLSWMEHASVCIRSEGDDQSGFRFHLRNLEADCSTPHDYSSRKYNEGLLRPAARVSTVTLSRQDFHVPTWWVQRYNRTAEQARPRFDQVESIEITTVARHGKGKLKISGIRVTGHWITQAALTRGLLVMWMSTFFVVLIARVWQLRRELSARTKSEQALLEANSELSHQSMKLSEIACRDALTGLFNRRGIRDSISNLMDEWNTAGKRFAVITFDLDRFKDLNDTHGHAFGDAVLCEASRIAIGQLRGRDLIARWGGEEFLIVCAGVGESAAANLAERLRGRFSTSELGFTCSFGVSEAADGDDFDKILHRADQALYRSKTSGRNKVTTYKDVSNAMNETLPSAVAAKTV